MIVVITVRGCLLFYTQQYITSGIIMVSVFIIAVVILMSIYEFIHYYCPRPCMIQVLFLYE